MGDGGGLNMDKNKNKIYCSKRDGMNVQKYTSIKGSFLNKQTSSVCERIFLRFNNGRNLDGILKMAESA